MSNAEFESMTPIIRVHDMKNAVDYYTRILGFTLEWAKVEDIDGNVLRIGSDPKDGMPFGDWLDMNGVRWRKKEDGDWMRVE